MTRRLLAAVLLLFFWGCGGASSQPPEASARRTPCPVLVNFDGDTLACDLNGNHRVDKPVEYIRFIGLDAPETRHSRRYRGTEKEGVDEPYAQEASRFVKTKTYGKTVYLEWDREKRDPYDRSLAYVYLGPEAEVSLNEMLLRRGLATVLFYAPNTRYRERFRAAEAEARQNRRGVWSAD